MAIYRAENQKVRLDKIRRGEPIRYYDLGYARIGGLHLRLTRAAARNGSQRAAHRADSGA